VIESVVVEFREVGRTGAFAAPYRPDSHTARQFRLFLQDKRTKYVANTTATGIHRCWLPSRTFELPGLYLPYARRPMDLQESLQRGDMKYLGRRGRLIEELGSAGHVRNPSIRRTVYKSLQTAHHVGTFELQIRSVEVDTDVGLQRRFSSPRRPSTAKSSRARLSSPKCLKMGIAAAAYCTRTTTPAVSGHHQTCRCRSTTWSSVTTQAAGTPNRQVICHPWGCRYPTGVSATTRGER